MEETSVTYPGSMPVITGRVTKIKEITGWHGPRPKALPVVAAFLGSSR